MVARKTPLALGAALSAALLAVGLLAPGASTAASDPVGRAAASLSMSPKNYVGGQGITLTGQLPERGVRNIWLERNMNRPGDEWTRVEDLPYHGQTRADGSFTMKIHAPDMTDLSYRVRGGNGGGVTPGVRFEPKTQDVTLEVVDPLALGAIAIVADTTPDLFRRPDTIGLPIFAGRDLTLQRRVTPTKWEDIEQTQVRIGGLGVFPTFAETAGEHVYRVVMEDWKQDGSDIGWQASFPTYVTIGALRPVHPMAAASRPVAATAVPAAQREVVVTGTAASKYHWNPVRWGFDWEEGQDLDSPPKNGVKKGHWVQYADGAGRVGKHNGGLRLDSARLEKDGAVDFGTTRATLQGNAYAYGRWETRLRMKTFETAQKDYDVALELVPERATDYNCGRRNITIARYTGTAAEMTFGVNAGNKRWTRTIKAPSLSGNIPAFAVEVAKGHIAWFINGQVVGVVKDKAAVSDVPMTLRFSLVGNQNAEYDNTSIYSDWQRSFDIDSGDQVTRGPDLRKQDLNSCPE